MSRALDDLDGRFQPVTFALIARAAEAGIPCMIIDTLRTSAQQVINLANGSSWIEHSLHLDGLAIDIAPYYIYNLHGPNKLQWSTTDPAWAILAAIGRKLGLRCGFDWKQKDCGHFEMTGVLPAPKHA